MCSDLKDQPGSWDSAWREQGWGRVGHDSRGIKGEKWVAAARRNLRPGAPPTGCAPSAHAQPRSPAGRWPALCACPAQEPPSTGVVPTAHAQPREPWLAGVAKAAESLGPGLLCPVVGWIERQPTVAVLLSTLSRVCSLRNKGGIGLSALLFYLLTES